MNILTQAEQAAAQQQADGPLHRAAGSRRQAVAAAEAARTIAAIPHHLVRDATARADAGNTRTPARPGLDWHAGAQTRHAETSKEDRSP